jgi:transcriptional regulator with XRE-family HTH domain
MLTEVQPAIIQPMAKPLNAYREDLYLTVDEFAELLGITPRTMYRIIRGDVQARPTTMRKIAARLGVHPSEISEFARPAREE